MYGVDSTDIDAEMVEQDRLIQELMAAENKLSSSQELDQENHNFLETNLEDVHSEPEQEHKESPVTVDGTQELESAVDMTTIADIHQEQPVIADEPSEKADIEQEVSEKINDAMLEEELQSDNAAVFEDEFSPQLELSTGHKMSIESEGILDPDLPVQYQYQESSHSLSDPSLASSTAFLSEYESVVVLEQLMLAAYIKVAQEEKREDGILLSQDLIRLITYTLNPEEHVMHASEVEMIAQEANALREIQGLVENKQMHNGFITRGSPLRHFRKMATFLHQTRRRLQEA